MGVASGDQAQNGPRALRRRARAGRVDAVIVAGAAFAPTAVRVLDGTQPLAAAQDVGFAVALARRRQAPQRETSAIDVRHAPTAVPASIGLLVLDEPLDAAPHRAVIAAHSVRRQRFQSAPGDVRAGGIEHGVVIGEGNVVQKLPVVVGVESRPSAIARLHGQQPVDRPLVAGLLRRGIGGRRLAQRQHHHGGVVDIRVVLVAVKKAPSGRLGVGPLYGPIALAPDLFRQQPIGRPADRRVVRAALCQRVGADGGIPNRREARLEEEPFAIVHHEVVEVAQRLHPQGVVLGIAQRIQRHHRIHHGRIDGAQPVGTVHALDHPRLGSLDGLPPDALRPAALPPLQQPVHCQEDVVPGEPAGVFVERGAHARKPDLIQVETRRNRTARVGGMDDGQRHHDGARPRRHLV